ncbi:hypothetical protein M1B72_17055 [Geomonas paludis]|uniref:Uncharacterized protein n=1 Tax=Geomonas paludis TaxID=2740185 RepID=A0ABY4LC43_9BACT|nr:hypothetical protein [Geomonas paludis]UPU35145.1 hypothetical protein M1B72_17055 [Geomonas paludis]
MEHLVAILKVQVVVLVVALYVAAIFQVTKGKSGIRGGVISTRRRNNVTRFQLLGVTVLTSGYFTFRLIENPSQLPAVPPELFYILGGSNLLYLAGKFLSR